jgi:hypothetical protein
VVYKFGARVLRVWVEGIGFGVLGLGYWVALTANFANFCDSATCATEMPPTRDASYRVQSSGYSFGFRDQGADFRVQSLGVWGVGFRVYGLRV